MTDESHWNSAFLRSPNDRQGESVCDLLALLVNRNVAPHGNDEFVCPCDLRLFYCNEFVVVKGEFPMEEMLKRSPNGTIWCPTLHEEDETG